MAIARGTNDPQRLGAEAADHFNVATCNEFPANETVTLLIQRVPLPMFIEPLQDPQLVGIPKLDRRGQCHSGTLS